MANHGPIPQYTSAPFQQVSFLKPPPPTLRAAPTHPPRSALDELHSLTTTGQMNLTGGPDMPNLD